MEAPSTVVNTKCDVTVHKEMEVPGKCRVLDATGVWPARDFQRWNWPVAARYLIALILGPAPQRYRVGNYNA